MRNRLGIACIVLGVLMVLGACGWLVHNQLESRQAQEASEAALEQMLEHFAAVQVPEAPEVSEAAQEEETVPSTEPVEYPDPYETEMPQTEFYGYNYIGYLSIPALGKLLPVMAEWDYSRLRIAPCRYKGGTRTEDLIFCAHNYQAHFGDISSLQIGDEVTFADMDGFVTVYEVAEVTTLQPEAIAEMESGEYPLTLFTCTYGGQSRVTGRCTKA